MIISRSDALKDGLKRYFTGKPCSRGHIADRYTCSYSCVECTKHHSGMVPKDRKAERDRDYRLRNIDRLREMSREYRVKNKESLLARERKWRKNNPNYNSEYYEANKERENGRSRSYREKNPEKSMQYARNRHARKSRAEGCHTASDIKRILGAQRSKCAYCKTSLKGGYHVDHIIALANGGTNWPSNLQCLCQSCNLKKNAKDPIDFAQKIGLLL